MAYNIFHFISKAILSHLSTGDHNLEDDIFEDFFPELEKYWWGKLTNFSEHSLIEIDYLSWGSAYLCGSKICVFLCIVQRELIFAYKTTKVNYWEVLTANIMYIQQWFVRLVK